MCVYPPVAPFPFLLVRVRKFAVDVFLSTLLVYSILVRTCHLTPRGFVRFGAFLYRGIYQWRCSQRQRFRVCHQCSGSGMPIRAPHGGAGFIGHYSSITAPTPSAIARLGRSTKESTSELVLRHRM